MTDDLHQGRQGREEIEFHSASLAFSAVNSLFEFDSIVAPQSARRPGDLCGFAIDSGWVVAAWPR
jgi:hypothetical protein